MASSGEPSESRSKGPVVVTAVKTNSELKRPRIELSMGNMGDPDSLTSNPVLRSRMDSLLKEVCKNSAVSVPSPAPSPLR